MNVLNNVPVLILIGAVVVPAIVYLVLGLGEGILKRFGASGNGIRPWLWLLVPLLVIGVVLIYPLIATIVYAFFGADGTTGVGLDNFAWSVQGEMRSVIGNNIIWLIAFPVITLVLALVAAVLFDKVRYEKLAMSIILLPTAISFVAGSVIWRQIYVYSPPGSPQRGTLNALWTLIPGTSPVAWLQTPVVNTLALVFVAVWSTLGISALILSAAVKTVPAEMLEAARMDGAGEWRIFRSMVLPSIVPAVLVVVTTQVIFALKIFDIIYVMTNGNFNTNTIANRMYFELFAANNLGHASAIAVILLIVALPVIFINIRQFRNEEAAA